jgi:hypothetical protein
MLTLERISAPDFDPATGLFLLPTWTMALAALVFAILVILAIWRAGVVAVFAIGLRVAIVVLIAWGAWLWADRSVERDRADERRSLQMRASELALRAATPSSSLGCLDGTTGDTVENACETALFATPANVASASAFVAARLALFADAVDFALRANASYEELVPGLRHALESDRFGLVAQVLASRDGCTAERCETLTLFREPARIKTNLQQRSFDSYVARNSANWPGPAGASAQPTASAPATSVPGANILTGSVPIVPPTGMTGPSPVPPGFNLPSAASIPPVSIMTPEPSATTTAAPPVEAAAGRPPPQRRPAARAPAVPPPVQISPPPAAIGNPPRP